MTEQNGRPLWEQIDDIKRWLDKETPSTDPDKVLSMRMHKITEEVGEVAQAYVGVTGFNPRKGTSHTVQDLAKELCDVILTAQVALATVVDEPAEFFGGHLASVHERSLGIARHA